MVCNEPTDGYFPEELVFEFDTKELADGFLKGVREVAKRYLYATVIDIYYVKGHAMPMGTAGDASLYNAGTQYGINKPDIFATAAVHDPNRDLWIVRFPKPEKISLGKDGIYRPGGGKQ